MRAVAIVPAAGSAERFGGGKLLTPIDGEPMLDHTIRALLDGGASEIIVVVGRDARAELERDVNTLLDPRVRAVMPFVSADTVRAVIEKFATRHAIVSPRYRGKRGHPVALPTSLRDEIAATDPHANLHEVIKKHPDMRVDLDVDDPGVVRDVDTLADLEERGASS
ncbi:MAG: nucleotidyltransferase family protein [Chloroflexi bacterium]|nr:MAG: nucleotidyltransferase family protein [Chloroflexota bacterium]